MRRIPSNRVSSRIQGWMDSQTPYCIRPPARPVFVTLHCLFVPLHYFTIRIILSWFLSAYSVRWRCGTCKRVDCARPRRPVWPFGLADLYTARRVVIYCPTPMASSSRGKGKRAQTQGQKRSSALLDPAEELRALQSTTEVELLNLSSDGRNRRVRTRPDVVPTAPRPLNVSLFDLPYDNSEDPNFMPPSDQAFNFGSFDWDEGVLFPPPDIPGLTVKSTQRTKRYLNSVRILPTSCVILDSFLTV